MPFFLGIDGGGSKTRCVLGDNNSVLATSTASGCNILRVGEAFARDSLAAAIHEACVQAGVSPQHITRTCAGVAGAADDGIASTLQRLLIEIIGGAIEVIGDIEIALESAFGDGPGIVVIAGTGSIAYARNSEGRTARAGGWGRIISDEGSGHWIGLQAIRDALREHDQIERSELLERLKSALNGETLNDLVTIANAHPAPDFASLFPVVLEAAEAGNSVATNVLKRAGDCLASLAATLVSRLFAENQEIAVASHGGVFASSVLVREAFDRALRSKCAQAKQVATVVDPALGALQRARREFGNWHRSRV